MGETCGVCGRDRGRGAHAGDPLFVTSESAECYRLGYDRSQAALAAARRECEGLRAALENMLRRYNEMPPVDHDCHCWTWFFPEVVSEARTALAAGEKTT